MTTPYPLPTTDLFGGLAGAAEVRQAMVTTLKLWTPTYIAEVAARTGLTMRPFEDWKLRPEYRTLPVNNSPACLITCLGTLGEPAIRGNGSAYAVWTVEVSIVVFGDDWETTADLTGHYTTALRAAVLQHRDLGGFAGSTKWLGEKYTEIEHSSTRTLGVAVIHFAVAVDHVVDVTTGPATPTSPNTLPPIVAASGVHVTVQKL
jgi:hypothetical protein